MKKIEKQEILFNAIVYYPILQDLDWDQIKGVIKKEINKDKNKQTIYDTANFLKENFDIYKGNEILKIIREIYEKFEFENIYSEDGNNGIEACPSEDKKSIFIRGGNKRLIAYAMRLLNKKEKFKPIKISHWVNKFERQDKANINHKKTVKNAKIK